MPRHASRQRTNSYRGPRHERGAAPAASSRTQYDRHRVRAAPATVSSPPTPAVTRSVKAGANSAAHVDGADQPDVAARGRIGIVVHAGPGPSVEHSTVRRFCQERHNAEAARYEHVAVHAASVPTRTAAGAAVHGHRELARRLVELPQPYRVLHVPPPVAVA